MKRNQKVKNVDGKCENMFEIQESVGAMFTYLNAVLQHQKLTAEMTATLTSESGC